MRRLKSWLFKKATAACAAMRHFAPRRYRLCLALRHHPPRARSRTAAGCRGSILAFEHELHREHVDAVRELRRHPSQIHEDRSDEIACDRFLAPWQSHRNPGSTRQERSAEALAGDRQRNIDFAGECVPADEGWQRLLRRVRTGVERSCWFWPTFPVEDRRPPYG